MTGSIFSVAMQWAKGKAAQAFFTLIGVPLLLVINPTHRRYLENKLTSCLKIILK